MKIVLTSIWVLILVVPVFIISVPLSRAQEDKNGLHEQFLNIEEAQKHNCTIVDLKGLRQKSCVLQNFEDHELRLAIYDANTKGQLLKSQELCIPSWYQKATVKYLDLLGEGKQFIVLTFEGNTGTGTLQMIRMFIAWHNGKFVPTLAETVDYDLTEGSDVVSLKMTYKIKNKGSSKVKLFLKYNFTAWDIEPSQVKSTSTWYDTLIWDKETYSFYNADAENAKVWQQHNGFLQYSIQRKISKVRVSIKDVDATDLCHTFFDETHIMSVLYPDKDKL